MKDTEEATVKAHCPTCDDTRKCERHAYISKKWEWYDEKEAFSINGGDDYSLLECKGCETVFYEKISWNSEDIDYWYDHDGATRGEYARTINTYPKPESKTKPAWIDSIQQTDEQLHKILEELYIAYDNDLYVLASIGLRTAVDRSTEVLGIDPAKSFQEKLTALKDGGWIGDTEKDILDVVTDAGNAAAHRAWIPKKKELVQLFSATEIFLQRAFIVGKTALNLKQSIPAKPKRQK